VCETLGTSVFVTDLEIATASYERQVDELVAEDEDTAAYVRDLETEWDEADDDDLGGSREVAHVGSPQCCCDAVSEVGDALGARNAVA